MSPAARNHCPDCFQPQTWDFDYGRPFTDDTEQEDFRRAGQALYPDGLTVLGGEPFRAGKPAGRCCPFLREVRGGRYPEKDHLGAFTGFRLEDELLRGGRPPRCAVTDELLSLIDVLVDGRFVAAEKDISLQFREQPEPAGAGPAENRCCRFRL